MEREQAEEIVDCADCGLPLDVERERGYRGHQEWALCRGCALQRGAQFDEDEDIWIVPPDLTDLPGLRDHRVR